MNNKLENDFINFSEAITQPLNNKLLNEMNCKADVLRIDKIHPVISGNKYFKLKYNIQEAENNGCKVLLTFGGAYSNHIIATAAAAKHSGLNSIGIIRGEESQQLSHTLISAKEYGMQLEFISRSDFKNRMEIEYINNLKNKSPSTGFPVSLNPRAEPWTQTEFGNPDSETRGIIKTNKFGDFYLIPEGGSSQEGRKGSEEILKLTDYKKYSHIICAIGTGTMYSGIANASDLDQLIIGIPVLKGMNDLLLEYKDFIKAEKLVNCKIFYDYHYGGYAKKKPELINFMNQFFEETGIPTDFVYTGKLISAFMDLLKKGYFPVHSNILIIHSGGLQGNLSLPENILKF